MTLALTFALAEDMAPARLLLRSRITQCARKANWQPTFVDIPHVDELLLVLRTRSPDVLTLDLGFDGVGEEAGLEALGFIVGSHPNLPILVISAHQQLDRFRERLSAYPQVLACIHKSSQEFDFELAAALRAAVAWRSADQRDAVQSLKQGLDELAAGRFDEAILQLTQESMLTVLGPGQLEQVSGALSTLLDLEASQEGQRFRLMSTLLRVHMKQARTWDAFQLANRLQRDFPDRPVDVQVRILEMATLFHRETLALDAALQLGYRLLASQHWQAALDICDQIDARQAGIIPSLELRTQALASMRDLDPENRSLGDRAVAARLEWVRALRFNNEIKRAHMALKPLLQLPLGGHWQSMLAEEQARLKELSQRKPESAPYRPVRICGQGRCRDLEPDLVPIVVTDCAPVACDICGAFGVAVGEHERDLLRSRRLLVVGGVFPDFYREALLELGAERVVTHPGTGDLAALGDLVAACDGLVLVRGLSPEAGVIRAEACLESQDGKLSKPVATVRAQGPLQVTNAVLRGLVAHFAGTAQPAEPLLDEAAPALTFRGLRLRLEDRDLRVVADAHDAAVSFEYGSVGEETPESGTCEVLPLADGRGRVAIKVWVADPKRGTTLQPADISRVFGTMLEMAASSGVRTLALNLAGIADVGVSPKVAAHTLGLALQEHAMRSQVPEWLTVCVADVEEVFPVLQGAARMVGGRSFQPQILAQLAKARASGMGPELSAHLERLRGQGWSADAWQWLVLFRMLIDQWALDMSMDRTLLPAELGARLQHCLEGDALLAGGSEEHLAQHCRSVVDQAQAFMARGRLSNLLQDHLLAERLGAVSTIMARWLLERQGTETTTLSATRVALTPKLQESRRRGEGKRTEVPDTLPVRRLHDFLTTHLSPQTRRALHERLLSEGYLGDEHQCLLEYCVKEADLEQLLNNLFTQFQLREAVADSLGMAVDVRTTLRQLARNLLEALGFPVARAPRGLRSAVELAERLWFQRLTADPTTLRGMAIELAIDVEALLHQYLHAVVQFTTGLPADLGLRRLGLLAEEVRLERCTLGRLLELLVRLPAALDDLGDERASLAWESLGLDRIIPECASIVVRQRNAMSHPALTRETTQAPLSVDEVGQFVKATQELLAHFAQLQPKAFPRSILVQEVRVDQWGRRTTIGVDDAGRTELLFTEAWLRPGETYLMLATNNPLRVDPILIPWGCGERPRPQ